MGFMKSSLLVLVTAIFVSMLPKLVLRRLPKKGQGYAAPGPWRNVADVYRSLVDGGQEPGGAFALYHEGELVVQFAGGYADAEAGWAWDADTLGTTFSSCKAAAALTMALLVERGLLDYSRPVRQYWPEFGQNDKAEITVEQLFSHQAGLSAIDEKFSAYDILDDPEKVGALLARQPPLWTPGEGHGYHGITLGLYMDQLVRRVDPRHRSLSQFFQEEIAKPNGIDMFIGLPKEESYRAARVTPFSFLSSDVLFGQRYWPVMWEFLTNPASITHRSIVNPIEYTEDLANHPRFRALPQPSGHGYATAAGAAKLMGLVASGQLLGADALRMLSEPLTSGVDRVLLMNVTYGRGVTLRQRPGAGGWLVGAPGAGGQMMYLDPDHRLGWAYLTNHMSLFAIGDDPRYLALEDAIYASLSELHKKEGAGGGKSA